MEKAKDRRLCRGGLGLCTMQPPGGGGPSLESRKSPSTVGMGSGLEMPLRSL